MLTATGWKHIVNRKTSLTVGSNFRDASTDGEVIKVFPAGTPLIPFGDAHGSTAGDSDRWLACALWVDVTAAGKPLGRTVVGFFHSSVVGPLEPIDVVDNSAELAALRRAAAAGFNQLAAMGEAMTTEARKHAGTLGG